LFIISWKPELSRDFFKFPCFFAKQPVIR